MALQPNMVLLLVACLLAQGSGLQVQGAGCQLRSTRGSEYLGEANTTLSGRPCQVWSARAPHVTKFPEVGEHNYCRNPNRMPGGVFCYTTDPGRRWEYCRVPRFHHCPPLRLLDFSADSDNKRDSTGKYTHASLEKEAMPLSFTICSALMVKTWPDSSNAQMFTIMTDGGKGWLQVKFYATHDRTRFTIVTQKFSFEVTNSSSSVIFPHQWVRVCASLDAAFLVRLVVDGQLL